MLELIVLGEVPGTNIVITFHGAILLTALVIGIVFGKSFSKKYRDGHTQVHIEDITL